MQQQAPGSPKGNRRSTVFAPTAEASVRAQEMSFRGGQSGGTAPGARSVSYRDLQRVGSGGDMLEYSASGSRRSMRQQHSAEMVSKTHLSANELENMARLFNAFATEIEESDEYEQNAPSEKQGLLEDAHGMVLEIVDLKALLLCLGIRVTDEIFESMKLSYATRVPGEMCFDEFVTFMVTSQELRDLRDEMEEVEKSHAFDDASSKARFDADATWRWFWDAGVLVITSYYMTLISYEWVIPNPMTPMWWVAETIFCFFFLLDIGVYLNTRCRDRNGRPMITLADNLKVYATKTLITDVLGSLPVDLIISWIYPWDHHERLVWFIFRGFHLLRVFRAVTLFKGDSMHGFLRPTVVYLQYTIAPVLKALFYFVLVVHYLAIGWLIVQARSTNDNVEASYVDAMYIVLYTLSTVGYGDMVIEAGAQRVYCCFLFLGGVVMNGLVISQMSVFLSKADIQNDRKDKMRETLAVLRHFDIPDDTQQEILSFQHHVLSHNLGESHEELLGLLPQALQESLGLFMRIKFIAMVPMFASSPRDCQEALANTLKSEVFQPHQVIMVAGEIGNEMYFLGHGAADVIGPGGQHYATLRKGAFFGEIALLVDGARRNASIKALTYCDTFLLQKEDFTRIMGKFPHFRKILEEEVADRVAQEKEKQKGQQGKQRKRIRKRSAFGATSLDEPPQEMPEFDEQVQFESSRRMQHHTAAGSITTPHTRRGMIGFNSVGGGGGAESPRQRGHRQAPHRFGIPVAVDERGIGPRRTSLTAAHSTTHAGQRPQRNSNLAEQGFSEPEMLAELAERVAMLERRSSVPIPSVYTTGPHAASSNNPGGAGGQPTANAGHISNAGKSKDPFPGALIDVVSSDDDTSSRASPRRQGRSPGGMELPAAAATQRPASSSPPGY